MATINQVGNSLTGLTGTGSFVGANTPTLITPVLGVATATSVNKVALTAPATASTLTIADGKTMTCSNTLTFTGTDSSSVAFGAGGTVAYAANSTFTPALKFGGASVGMTYGTQTGYYTRIGDVVTFNIRIDLTAKGSSTGVATVTGMPVALKAGLTASTFTILPTLITSIGRVCIYMVAGGTELTFVGANETLGTLAAITEANFYDTTSFTITGSYLV